MTFVSQIVLGWLLSKDDFSTYAIVVGLLNFTGAITHGGANLLLLQASNRVESRIPPAIRLATIFDLSITLLLLAIALPMGHAFESEQLALLISIVALSTPLRILALPFRARAAASGSFGIVSLADVAQAVTQQCLIMAFAVSGFGVFSFVLGQPLVNLLDWLILRRLVKRETKPERPREIDSLKSLLHPASLVLITAVGIAFATGGTEYLLLAAFSTPMILAEYFFAYRLTAAIGLVFGSGIRTVLIPSFSRLADEPERQRVAALSAVRTFLALAILVCGVGGFLAPAIMHMIWQGKWDGAAVAAAALLFSLPYRISLYLSRSFIESLGRWGRSAVLTWFDGICLAAVVWTISGVDDLMIIAWAICTYRGLGGIALTMIALRAGGIRTRDTLRVATLPAVGVAALSILWLTGFPVVHGTIDLRLSVSMAGVFVGIYLCLLVLVARNDLLVACDLIRRRNSR